MLCDAGQYPRADFLAFVKGENVIGPTRTSPNAVRSARLPFTRPTNAKQRGQNLPGFGRRPMAHDIANTSLSSGISSPYSSRSAIARNANALAFETASFRLSPYAMTPGSSGISAIHRPSSSLSISIFIINPVDAQMALPKGMARGTFAIPAATTRAFFRRL